MEIDLHEKITLIIGLNGSGKTYFAQNKIIPGYRCIIHDPLKQYPSNKCDVYHPKNIVYPAIAYDNEKFISWIENNCNSYDLLVFEECSRLFPNKKDFMPKMRSFFDTYRHFNNIGMVFICRRPAQINTEITNLAHHIISFGNKGKADIQTLNQESEGLGDLCKTLSNYEFVFVDQDRNYKKMGKI